MESETDHFNNIANSMPNIADKILEKFKFDDKIQPLQMCRMQQSRPYGILPLATIPTQHVVDDINVAVNSPTPFVGNSDIDVAIPEKDVLPVLCPNDVIVVPEQKKRVSFKLSDVRNIFEKDKLMSDLNSYRSKEFGLFLLTCILITLGIYGWEFMKNDDNVVREPVNRHGKKHSRRDKKTGK